MSVFLPENWNARRSSDWLDLIIGLWLSLAFLKFGTPVNISEMAVSPADIYEFLLTGWPLQWGYVVSAVMVVFVAVRGRFQSGFHWLLAVGGVWYLWNWVASADSVDAGLTGSILVHFSILTGLVWMALIRMRAGMRLSWFSAGLAAGFLLTLWSGIQQKFGGLEATREYIYSMEGWENLPAEYLYRIARDRIFATLPYPNTFAALIILVAPLVIGLGWHAGRGVRGRQGAILVSLIPAVLAIACLVWTGSKAGFLVALLQAGIVALIHLPYSKKIKLTVSVIILVLGLGAFLFKYQDYLRDGAKSLTVGRFGYWRAAAITVSENPITGSGPGTFVRAFEKLKRPGDEMTRLTHNDYLQQASDAGIPAALAYSTFIVGILILTIPVRQKSAGATERDPEDGQGGSHQLLVSAMWVGCIGWALHSLMEWTLYVPSTAWTAFVFLALLLGDFMNRRPPADKM